MKIMAGVLGFLGVLLFILVALSIYGSFVEAHNQRIYLEYLKERNRLTDIQIKEIKKLEAEKHNWKSRA